MKNHTGDAVDALSDDGADHPRTVWRRHVQAAMAGDIDAILSDFTEQSAIVTLDGVFAGIAAIRGFLKSLLARLDEEAHRSTVFNVEMVHGDALVASFTINAIDRTFYDTAVIRKGKFIVLSTVNYPSGLSDGTDAS